MRSSSTICEGHSCTAGRVDLDWLMRLCGVGAVLERCSRCRATDYKGRRMDRGESHDLRDWPGCFRGNREVFPLSSAVLLICRDLH